ncbi:hypothetical protein BKA59DRAFT_466623 [Fusarium tricinctum]|uniref:BHLH domain-containing protein n=1 Tax=Fusarium tricinctum TaxID=61284 RepID=A0A8K0SEE0_9HYPO|nr:hypothetical protein BKA59DRAFT_466623 [Fusarium tricinctum]
MPNLNMSTHTIAVDPSDSWDRRNSGHESLPACHFLDQIDQIEEGPVEIEDLIYGNSSWRLGSYNPNLSALDSSLADPLSWDPTTSPTGTSDPEESNLSQGITMRPDLSEFGRCSMNQDKGLSLAYESKGPTATSVSLQTDRIEDDSKPSAPAKMRSASRKPKTFSRGRPSLPASIRQARKSHNNVERQYRSRLKFRFERLLSVLQASMPKAESKGENGTVKDDYCFSRGEVLDAARDRILTLEKENRTLATRVEFLSQNLVLN